MPSLRACDSLKGNFVELLKRAPCQLIPLAIRQLEKSVPLKSAPEKFMEPNMEFLKLANTSELSLKSDRLKEEDSKFVRSKVALWKFEFEIIEPLILAEERLALVKLVRERKDPFKLACSRLAPEKSVLWV